MMLRGRVVLVTGASSGIGEAIARRLGPEGATVAMLARNEGELSRVAAHVSAGGGTPAVYPVDLSDHRAVSAVAAEVQRDLGTPDVLINNAGSAHRHSREVIIPRELRAIAASARLTPRLVRALQVRTGARRAGR